MTGRRTLGQGTRALEIINVSPTSHAASMLVVYVPSQRLLFQGDLLRINQQGGAVTAPDANRDLAIGSSSASASTWQPSAPSTA